MALVTTPNLYLPQWTPNEKPSYMVDFNNAFKSIDDSFAEIYTEAESATQKATDAMAEAASATSKAQEAMQTANQAQSMLNNHIQSTRPNVVPAQVAINNNLGITYEVQVTYNAACANIALIMTFGSPTHQMSNVQEVGKVTFPANITLTNRTQIHLAASGYGIYADMIPEETPNVYTVRVMIYTPTNIVNSSAVNSSTYPAHISHGTRTADDLITITLC